MGKHQSGSHKRKRKEKEHNLIKSQKGANVDDSFRHDIFDPVNWDSPNCKQINILAQKSPIRDLSIKKGYN